MARHYYWLKLNDDFFRDSSVKKLRSIAGGDTYTIIYLKLLLLSLPTDGKLYYEGLDEDFASQVALEIDEEVENVNVTLRFLEARRILIQNTDTEFELSTEPEMVGSESESAKRMRKMRQRQLLISENSEANTSHCDGYVTESDENVTQSKSKSKSKSLELEKIKEEKEENPVDIETVFEGEMLQTVRDWLDYKKKEKRYVYKARGLNSLITQLKKAIASSGEAAVIDMIQTSMANGYQGIIFDKIGNPKDGGRKPFKYDYKDEDSEVFPF